MYATCLWCQRPLGRNEVLEAFPVGRRLAFDTAKGRLWVVCPSCERWNLTPLEERGAVIEGCERRFRDTRTRASTGEIGLAKVSEGLELVRIGAPLLPEFAAWRYGDQFGRRRRRATVVGAAGVVAVGGIMAGQFSLGLTTFGLFNVVQPLVALYKRRRRAATIELPGGKPAVISLDTIEHARAILQGTRLRFAVPRFDRRVFLRGDGDDVFRAADRVAANTAFNGSLDLAQWHVLEGALARDALAKVLPAVNATGGSRATIERSVALVQEVRADDPAVALLGKRTLDPTSPLSRMEPSTRLALEMVLHEADERRWLEGELAELERRWKEAETLAGIIDRLGRPAPDEGTARNEASG